MKKERGIRGTNWGKEGKGKGSSSYKSTVDGHGSIGIKERYSKDHSILELLSQFESYLLRTLPLMRGLVWVWFYRNQGVHGQVKGWDKP